MREKSISIVSVRHKHDERLEVDLSLSCLVWTTLIFNKH